MTVNPYLCKLFLLFAVSTTLGIVFNTSILKFLCAGDVIEIFFSPCLGRHLATNAS